VTQDADFHEYSLLYGGPPLVVWLRCGNQPKTFMLKKLRSSRPIIEAAALDPEVWSLKIY
jgi:predicted nuclease of predicted toxin-antitoxin system